MKVTTTVKVDPAKRDAIQNLGYSMSKILDEAMNAYITGGESITPALKKLKEERRSLMEKVADLTVKEMAIRAKKENLEREIKVLTEEIGAMEGQQQDDENADRITELLREINSAIIENEYNYAKVSLETSAQVEELKSLMPSFELEKQIEIMKSFAT